MDSAFIYLSNSGIHAVQRLHSSVIFKEISSTVKELVDRRALVPRRGVSRIPMPVDHSQSVYAALKACEKSVLHKKCMKNVRSFLGKRRP